MKSKKWVYVGENLIDISAIVCVLPVLGFDNHNIIAPRWVVVLCYAGGGRTEIDFKTREEAELAREKLVAELTGNSEQPKEATKDTTSIFGDDPDFDVLDLVVL